MLGELAAITPGPYLHIGGDEANTLTEEQYKTFMARVQPIVASHGKTMVGWEEIGEAALTTPVIDQHWVRINKSVAAAGQSALIIASPAFHAYLDMKLDESTPIGQVWAGLVDLDTTYDWDPVGEQLTEQQVIGVEEPLWTEYVETQGQLDLLAYPRLAGHAEVGWSTEANRSWESYKQRMAYHGRRLEQLGVEFYRSTLIDWSSAQ